MTSSRHQILVAVVVALCSACEDGLLEPGSAIELEPLWVQPGSFRSGPPKAGPGHFLVSGCPVAAVDSASGEVLWEAAGPCGLRFGPRFTVVGEVVIASAAGLYAVDAEDGRTLWAREDAPNGAVAGSATDGVFSTDGGDLVAYGLETGEERWRATLEPGGYVNLGAGQGLVCAERLISPPGAARIECFSTSDGRRRWTRHVGTAAWVVVTAGVVVVAGADREYETGWIVLDPETGETLWRITGGLPDAGPAISPNGEVLYTCSKPATAAVCIALRAVDGAVLWVRQLAGIAEGPPVLGGGVLLVAAYTIGDQGQIQSAIHVLDLETGATRFRILPPPPLIAFSSHMAVVGDIVLVEGCCDFRVAYRLP